MRNTKTRNMVETSLFCAIIIMMGLVPKIGFIKIGLVDITLLFIPVLVGTILGDFKRAIILGLAFGVSSWIVALTRGSGPADIAFQNPLVSVLPRVLLTIIFYACIKYVNFKNTFILVILFLLLGVGAYFYGDEATGKNIAALLSIVFAIILAVLNIFFDIKEYKYLVPAIISITISSIFVIAGIGITLGFREIDSLAKFVITILFTNTLAEIVITVILIHPIAKALERRNNV